MEMFGSRREAALASAASAPVAERMAFLKKVYGLLTFSLGTAAIGAYVGQTLSPGLMIPLFIAEIVLIFVAMGVKRVRGWNMVALFAFTSLSGVTLGPVMVVYGASAVQEALLLTVVIFGALTMYVMTSKKDFSFMGGFLVVGLVAIIAGSLLQIFFPNPMMQFVISGAGVLLFCGFILYDTSNILRNYDVEDYTAATLALYLDILNLFLFLLRLLSRR